MYFLRSSFLTLRRKLLPLFVVLCAVTALPRCEAAAMARAEIAGGDSHRFLADLATAERSRDYRALLAECDGQVVAHPGDYETYRRRALARWGARQYDGALGDFGHAIDLARRQKAPARLLAIMLYGRALIQREKSDPAAEADELERTVRTDRAFTDAMNDLAWIRATNPSSALRNGRQAVDLARRACATLPDSVKYLDTLAAAYAESGDAKRAADTEKAAIKAAQIDVRTTGEYKEFLAGAAARAELYARGERYHESARKSAAPPHPDA